MFQPEPEVLVVVLGIGNFFPVTVGHFEIVLQHENIGRHRQGIGEVIFEASVGVEIPGFAEIRICLVDNQIEISATPFGRMIWWRPGLVANTCSN